MYAVRSRSRSSFPAAIGYSADRNEPTRPGEKVPVEDGKLMRVKPAVDGRFRSFTFHDMRRRDIHTRNRRQRGVEGEQLVSGHFAESVGI